MDSRAKILEKKIKKSSLRADNIFEYEYLMKETRGLLPCHITEEGEDVCFEFDLTGMHPLSELKKEEMEYRLRFLQNFYEIYRIWTEYDLPLTEENIYYDRNYVPYIAFRDMKQLKKEDEEEYEFRNAYQELAVGILGNKYSYTQVRESGLMIAAKDKALGYILACKQRKCTKRSVNVQSRFTGKTVRKRSGLIKENMKPVRKYWQVYCAYLYLHCFIWDIRPLLYCQEIRQ